jgi:hypothetical protein
METLPSLPVEIFHTIIDHLDDIHSKARGKRITRKRKHHIHQLRLACREIEFKTRIRYGRQFSSTKIRIGPGGFQTAYRITADEIFRPNVNCLRLKTMFSLKWLHEYEDLDAMIHYIMNGNYISDLKKLLGLASGIKSLELVCSKGHYRVSGHRKDRFRIAWYKAIQETFRALSTLDSTRLNHLSVGSTKDTDMFTPMHFMCGIPNASTAFSQLTRPDLFNITANTDPQISLWDLEKAGMNGDNPSDDTVAAPDSFFIHCANLRSLSYAGRNDLHGLDILRTFGIESSHILPLSSLKLTHCATDGDALLTTLLKLAPTLCWMWEHRADPNEAEGCGIE